MFPVLTTEEIERMRRFATALRLPTASAYTRPASQVRGCWSCFPESCASPAATDTGTMFRWSRHGVGSFSGEVGQLSGRRSFVDGVAVGDLAALLIKPDQPACVADREAGLGENIMRALILRRVGLLETGAGGPVLIGENSSATSRGCAAFSAATAFRTFCSIRPPTRRRGRSSSATPRDRASCRLSYAPTAP